jgi:hypothetical protein
MLGFIVGGLCLAGLFAMRRHAHRGCGGRHRRWHARREDDEESGPGGGFWLYRLFEKLDTSPGQEKQIRRELGELRGAMRTLWRERKQSLGDVARAVEGESLDETLLRELFARHDEQLREVRKTAVGALARIHEVLDEQQRRKLARLLGRWAGWSAPGPYRSAG